MSPDSMISLTEVTSLQNQKDLALKYYGKRKVGKNNKKRKLVKLIKKNLNIFLFSLS